MAKPTRPTTEAHTSKDSKMWLKHIQWCKHSQNISSLICMCSDIVAQTDINLQELWDCYLCSDELNVSRTHRGGIDKHP